MKNFPSVLIVGAGPTGLMMACELARRGISFRIIDKKPTQIQTTNAAVVHTRTLEIFDQMGMIERFLKAGQKLTAFHLWGNHQELACISFQSLNVYYNFALLIPQKETERILNERLEELHGYVERPLELIKIRQEKEKIISLVRDEEREEYIESDWLIGCDGMHSVVRDNCHISFNGEDLPQEFVVADLHLQTQVSSSEAVAYLGKGTILSLFPLKEDIYRIAANLGNEEKGIRTSIPEKEIEQIIKERSYGMFTLKSCIRISPFWIHSRLAEEMEHGNIFLAGDAAHVHSPAGAQGMNTGLQDAYNLAWKLALVIKRHAQPALLKSYEAERYPVNREIVHHAERLTNLSSIQNSFLIKLRNFFIKLTIGKSAFLQHRLALLLSQLSFRYKHSPVIHYETNVPSSAPQPGERAPDVQLESIPQRLYDYLHGIQHHLLIFTGPHTQDTDLTVIKHIQDWVKSYYSEELKCYIISPQVKEEQGYFILDPRLSIHQRYSLKQTGLCLIRPDNYIAFFNQGLDQSVLENFLNHYFIPQNSVKEREFSI